MTMQPFADDYWHPFIEIAQTAGSGECLRVRTGCNIRAGETVIRESAFFALQPEDLAKELRNKRSEQLEALNGDSDVERVLTNEWSLVFLIPCKCNGPPSCEHKPHQWDMQEVAFATSKLNHSCAPNVDKIDEGVITCSFCEPPTASGFCVEHQTRESTIVAIRDLHEGEELCVSYIHPTLHQRMTVQARQQYLRDNWQFDCHCSLCDVQIQVQESTKHQRIDVSD